MEQKIKEACIAFVEKSEPLEWEYERVGMELEEDMNYEELSTLWHFLSQEHDVIYEHFTEPFFEEHKEYDENDDEIFSLVETYLWDTIYKQDKYNCIVL